MTILIKIYEKNKEKNIKNVKTNKKKEKSFTLLELLIVIAVIAILSATVMVSLSGVRQSAWEAKGMQFSQNIKTTLADSLVGEWTFDDHSNPGRDDSGNGNNGTVYGATWTQNGKVRGALSFDGNLTAPQYIEIENKQNLQLDDFITNEVWIRPTSFSNNMIILSKGGGNCYPYSQYKLRITTDAKISVLIAHWSEVGGDGYFYYNATNSNLKLNEWNHIVIVITDGKSTDDEGQIKIFQNGNLVNQPTYTGRRLRIFERKLTIGVGEWDCSNFTNNSWSGLPFNGFIDEVRIYNRALTAYEIKALYAQGKMKHLADR